MTEMFLLQAIVVIIAIAVGAKLGGAGLGMAGGVGLFVLTFVFGLKPAAPPIDVMLIITAVVTAASTLQAGGGLEFLVNIAEKLLRKHPDRITFLAPIVTYLSTIFCGTGYVSLALYPVIAEVATEAGIRPERPMSIALVANQQAITASPLSAAMAAEWVIPEHPRVSTRASSMTPFFTFRVSLHAPCWGAHQPTPCVKPEISSIFFA